MTRSCPTCQREAKKNDNSAFPFCSSRCRSIDLGRWLDEEYRIPVEAEGAAAVEPSLSTDDDGTHTS
jgi:endogenous inhibitor of DNA gyrase (YacG/DUF329 family)